MLLLGYDISIVLISSMDVKLKFFSSASRKYFVKLTELFTWYTVVWESAKDYNKNNDYVLKLSSGKMNFLINYENRSYSNFRF